MEIKLLFVFFFTLILWGIFYLSYRQGKSSEKIKRLKEEIKQREREQAYVQSKTEFVRDLSSDDVNDRLRKIANKKQ